MAEEVINLRNITKTYINGKLIVPVLHGIDLTIYRGEFTSIMGPSGSGKSTFMNILGCLDRPTSGSYILNGEEVANLDDDQLAYVRNKEIGFVFQSFNLLSKLSAQENVALPMVYAGVGKVERNKRAAELLDALGLGDRLNHSPAELSGGQRQRVAIARALANDPSIIMADEPTGNLDSKSSIDVMNIFTKLYKEGRTIILVTHEPDIATYASRNVVLRDGYIVEDHNNNHMVGLDGNANRANMAKGGKVAVEVENFEDSEAEKLAAEVTENIKSETINSENTELEESSNKKGGDK